MGIDSHSLVRTDSDSPFFFDHRFVFNHRVTRSYARRCQLYSSEKDKLGHVVYHYPSRAVAGMSDIGAVHELRSSTSMFHVTATFSASQLLMVPSVLW